MVSLRCGMFEMWDFRYMGGSRCGMFGMWDVRACRMFGMSDVGCLLGYEMLVYKMSNI